MAGRIQGITVEIGGDTTKLQTALKGVNTEIRNTQSQLHDVDKLLKLDPGNTELLAQKHRLLGDAEGKAGDFEDGGGAGRAGSEGRHDHAGTVTARRRGWRRPFRDCHGGSKQPSTDIRVIRQHE